ncbi:MAG: ABC transporter permease [Chloroflexota bacterium]|nr:ABC transporter permease [Chloroflexota bacterium]
MTTTSTSTASPTTRVPTTSREQPRGSAFTRAHLRSTPGFYRRAWYQFRQNKIALAGLILSVLMVLFVLAAGIIANITGHTYWEGDLADQFIAPFSPGYLLGSDGNGRDVLVRAAYGGRISLTVAGLASLLLLVIGTTVGAISGYFGGFVDSVLMRIVDVLLCIPGLPLLILVFSVFSPGPYMLAVFIALLGWAGGARLIRGEVLSLRKRDYVEAARVLGASDSRIIFRHIIPNVIPLLLVSLSLALPGLILVEATLSFLGFGVQIPIPSWGNMLENAREYFTRSWANVLIPGLFIYVTVLSISLVGNGLRDALDPRLSR